MSQATGHEVVEMASQKKTNCNSLSFENKIIMAPMVRVGTLPMRLLALSFSADIVYTEELIDYRLLKCRRIENNVLGTVDYVDDDQNIVFRTCDKEKSQLVLQMGTCNPERALQVALKVKNDVAAIDINMGCPKEFSIKGGMGAALLTNPQKVEKILTILVQNTQLPITCKIRLLPTLEDSLKLAKLIENTGVSAIAIHGRKKEERPRHKNRNAEIKEIAQNLKIPVIANGGSGEITCYEDIEVFKENCGASSVMLARQIEKNCSILRPDGKVPLDDLIVAYLKLAIDYDNHFSNTKYCIQQMLGSLQESERGKKLLASQRMEEICELWDMSEYYEDYQKTLRLKAQSFQSKNKRKENEMDENGNEEARVALKKQKTENGETWVMKARYIKSMFPNEELPKTILLNWSRLNKKKPPFYKTWPVEKMFSSVVTIGGQKYSSSFFEKNKKYAEQSAALVASFALGLIDKDKIVGSATGLLGHEV